MRKLKDRMALGIISGLLSTILPQLSNFLQHKLKITDTPYAQIASILFLPRNKTKTLSGKALSVIIHLINTSFVGVLLTYIISLTGRDKSIVKGIGIGAMFWLLVNGLIYNVVFNVKSKKPLTPILSLFDHALGGALCGFFITKLGDDSLFPDKSIREQEKIPIVYNGYSTEKQSEKALYKH